jgi:hypothetical protein
MVKSGSHAAVTSGDISSCARKKIKRSVDLINNLARGKHPRPRGGKLNCKRHTLKALADLCHCAAVLSAQGKPGGDTLGALDKQLDRFGSINTYAALACWERQTTKLNDMLLSHQQPLARGHQDLDTGGVCEHTAYKFCQRRAIALTKQVLAIIKHKQQMLVAESLKQLIKRGLPSPQTEIERLGHGQWQIVCAGQRGEQDDRNAIGKWRGRVGLRLELYGDLCRQCGLSNTPWSDKCDKALLSLTKAVYQERLLGLAPDQLNCWWREAWEPERGLVPLLNIVDPPGSRHLKEASAFLNGDP